MNDLRQFDNNSTFFDIGIDKKIENFATLYCVMSETKKKRNNITKLALRYLLNDITLSNDELAIAKTIIDDSFYKQPRKYNHCKLCSDAFERETLSSYSSKYKFWDICFPTVPYFPGNMMVYLKTRAISKKENIWDLTSEELLELKIIIADFQFLKRTDIIFKVHRPGNMNGIPHKGSTVFHQRNILTEYKNCLDHKQLHVHYTFLHLEEHVHDFQLQQTRQHRSTDETIFYTQEKVIFPNHSSNENNKLLSYLGFYV